MKTVRDVTPPLTETQIAKRLSSENLDELLQLWSKEQGVAKRRDLELMEAALPFPTDANLRVLDMCCGPGDVGRRIWGRYRNSRIDCVDRDVFLISICNGINRREGVSAENFVRDLWNTDWHNGLRHDYDVVATANALHWFDAPRLVELFNDIFRLLRPGGVFLFVEPACAEKIFAAGFAEWKSRQPAREHTKFINSVMPKLASSPTLNALLESYNAAVSAPANELVHLYEIRDALATRYGGEDEALRNLQFAEKDWKQLGYLANKAPLKEGRHGGWHLKLRHASADELDEARRIARHLIEAFANQL
jgi:SAM-dependent methyltransferase